MTSSVDLPVPYALTPEGLELTAEFTVKLHLTPDELAATYAAPAQLALDLDVTAPSAEVAELVSRRPAHPDDVAELARLLRLCRRWSDSEVQARFLLASNWGQASLFGSGSEQ